MESTVSPQEADQESGAGSGGCLNDKEDLTHSFETVLKDLPEVLLYIKRLNEHIKKQQSTLVRLFEKLKEYKQSSNGNVKLEVKDASTQTDSQPEKQASMADSATSTGQANDEDQCSKWTLATGVKSGLSIADEVKKVAESAMQQTGFAYEETSGMYYDYNTGYYYNAEMGLYYDGNSGTYMYYNEGTKTYEFHSQAALPAPAPVPVAAPAPSQVGLPEIPGVSSGEDIILASIERLAKEKAATAASVVPDIQVDTTTKSVKSVLVLPDKTVNSKVKSLKSTIVQPDKVADTVIESVKTTERLKEPRKSSRPSLPIPDPLETKELDLLMPGSNPMAPEISKTNNEEKSPKESRHEHKRKGKHKKHKSKKKKKKRHRSSSRSDYSLEEGEWSGSSESEKEKETDNSLTVNIDKNDEEYTATNEVLSANESDLDMLLQPQKKQRTLSVDEASEAWPPCMRIIVQNTEVKNLSVGTLFIVTCKGGTLGREKFHAVCIPDINISKHHGIFKFDESDGNYFFTDYGSRNGTYVNKQRLSSAKQESEPCEIPHGTVITLGSTDLLCHIHPGRETCEECEPGVVAAKKAEDYADMPLPCSHTRESKSEKRLQELRRLRKRFGLESTETKGELAPGYEDRAEIRRVTIGSHNEHAKTEMASTRESIKATNKGFKMLAKMGWKEGESLGKDGTGLTEPVLVEQRADKAGLGADTAFVPTASGNARSRQRADKWQLARQRYGQLPDTIDGDVGPDD